MIDVSERSILGMFSSPEGFVDLQLAISFTCTEQRFLNTDTTDKSVDGFHDWLVQSENVWGL